MPIRPNVDPVITQNVYNLTSEKGYEGHRFNKNRGCYGEGNS